MARRGSTIHGAARPHGNPNCLAEAGADTTYLPPYEADPRRSLRQLPNDPEGSCQRRPIKLTAHRRHGAPVVRVNGTARSLCATGARRRVKALQSSLIARQSRRPKRRFLCRAAMPTTFTGRHHHRHPHGTSRTQNSPRCLGHQLAASARPEDMRTTDGSARLLATARC